MKKKRIQRYSLNERCDYYANIAKKEYEKNTKEKPYFQSKKCKFANGYLQAVSRGRPLNFDTLDNDDYKRGVLAGEKAKEKAKNIRFN